MQKKILLIVAIASSYIGMGQIAVPFQNLDSNVNSIYSEVRPTVSADGKILYFVVEGHPKNTKSKVSNKAQDIWFSEKGADGKWGQAKQAPSSLNNQKSNAVFWVSPDGNRLLIRGAYDSGKYVGRGISMTNKVDTGWAPAQKLNIQNYGKMSQDAYSGATMSNDGKTLLLYLSEEKNSYTNDLYVSFLTENNDWTQPKSLGADINSEDYNEITPFLAADGITLYYSSDRPGGKGSQDIWMSKRIDDSWTRWSEPMNVQSVNTSKWDAYFAIDANGENAYIATSQNSIGGTDIASVPLEEKERPKPVVLVYGKIFNADTKQPMSAKLYYDLVPGEENEGNAISSPEDGSYKIVLAYGKMHQIRASEDNFFPMLDTVDFTSVGSYKEVHRDIYLNPADRYASKNEERINIDSIEIDIDDNANGLKEDSNTKVIDSDGNTKEVATNEDKNVADVAGNQKGADLNGKTKKVKLGAEIVSSKGNKIILKEGAIVSMDNILFDFNKAILRAESYKQLDKAAKILKAYPNMAIELSAHTDNVGGYNYNIKLSEERAYSAREYLLSKGIEGARIQPKGYGEVKPIATNNNEAGRQQNRRVEFRILKN